MVEATEYPLERKWAIWEMWAPNHSRDAKQNWTDCMQQVYEFADLFGFWQAWNQLPHARPLELFADKTHSLVVNDTEKGALCIDALGVFEATIKPAWEDPVNTYGSDISLRNLLSNNIKDNWDRLVMGMIGETIPCNFNIVGCRLVDKKLTYKAEIWVKIDLKKEENAEIAQEIVKWLMANVFMGAKHAEFQVNGHSRVS